MLCGGGFLFGEKLFLVAALHDIGEDEDGDHEVEGGLGHGQDGVAADVKVGEVATFGEKHDAHDEEDKESQDFIHPILLQEGGYSVGEPNHEDSADNNRDDHELDALVAGRFIFGEGHRGENGIEREDDVHGDDEAHRFSYGGWLLVFVAQFVGAQHVEDFFDGSVEDKDAADEDDDGVQVEGAVDDAFDGGSGFFHLDIVMGGFGDDVIPEMDPEEGVLEFRNEGDDHKQEDDAEADGEADAQASHEGLLLGSDSFGLE